MKTKTIAAVILISSSILAYASVWNDSFIVDEIPHVGSGYSYVTQNDFRLNPEHPPIVKDLAGLALLPLNLNHTSFDTRFWNEDKNGQWEFGRHLIYGSGNDADAITRMAKLPMLLFFILSGIIIFLWTRKLYGAGAGLVALFLFSFSPTIVAHSRFVTTDMAALFGVLFGSYFFLQYLEHRSTKNLWLAGLAFGVAQLTKFSAFILAPYFVILAFVAVFMMHGGKIINLFKTALGTAAVFIIGFIFIVWPIYGIHTLNYPPEKQKTDTTYYLASYGNRMFADPVVWASDKPYIRSLAHYGTGLLMVNQRAIGGNTTYFLGEVRNWAWKHYFPVVYFIKEPLAFWGLLLAALLFAASQIRFNRYKITHWIKNHFVEFAMLLWLAIYWYLSIFSNLNIGVRHLIPTYGFVFILLSGQLYHLGQKLKTVGRKVYMAGSLVLTIFLGWYLYENIKVYPFYLTYFNQVAGGPEGGYVYVTDSNLDWGQDLKRLSDWKKENNIDHIHFDYFGWADPSYYLGRNWTWTYAGKYLSVEDFLRENPDGGYLAISATFYMGSREKAETTYAWLQRYEPVAVIGNSIFVWKIEP